MISKSYTELVARMPMQIVCQDGLVPSVNGMLRSLQASKSKQDLEMAVQR